MALWALGRRCVNSGFAWLLSNSAWLLSNSWCFDSNNAVFEIPGKIGHFSPIATGFDVSGWQQMINCDIGIGVPENVNAIIYAQLFMLRGWLWERVKTALQS